MPNVGDFAHQRFFGVVPGPAKPNRFVTSGSVERNSVPSAMWFALLLKIALNFLCVSLFVLFVLP